MKKVQNTRGYERYLALDIHREYILVGAWNEEKDWVLMPRRVSIERFSEWTKKNIRKGDIVVLETTTNVWATYDIVVPLASRVLVANAAEVDEIAKARVKTDKEDIKRLLKLLIGGIAPEVRIYDPVPNVITRRADLERAQLLVQSRSRPALQAFLQRWTEKLFETSPRGLRWHLDVDPIEFD